MNYVQFYGLIEPVNEQEMFRALVQIQNMRECWRPEIAGRCRDLIRQLTATSPLIPPDEKEVLTGNICNLLSALSNWGKKEYAGNTDYENKFYAAVSTAVIRIEKYYQGEGMH